MQSELSPGVLVATRAVSLVCSFLPTEAVAQDGLQFWDNANDRLFEVMVLEGDPSIFTNIFDQSQFGRVALALERFGEDGAARTPAHLYLQRFVGEGAILQLFLTGMDVLPVGFIVNFSSAEDMTILGLRGALSNCTEVNEPNCERVGLNQRSEITLGVAACQCWSDVDVMEINGQTMVLLPCYLGRGGTYLDWIFGFGPVSEEAGRFMDAASTAELGDLCAASGAAKSYPQFFLNREIPMTGAPLPEGVDPDVHVSLVIASYNQEIQPEWLLPYATWMGDVRE